MANTRLPRLLRLLTVLRARTARRACDIARELDVCERTVYRDLYALSLAGVPCRFDVDDGGYRIDGDFFLPPLQLTLSEALALSVLGSQLAGQKQLPFLQDAWQAVTKVRSQLPAAVREELSQSDGSVRVQTARVSPQTGCEPHFETIRRAIAQRRKLRCSYEGGKHFRTPFFLFRPYALFFSQRAWYVIGHSEAAGAEWSLKLNRFRELVQTDRPFMIPDGWSLEQSLGCAWRMIRGGRRYVVIRFDKEVGRNVSDTLWHTTQTVATSRNGSCRFECEVDGLDEIAWWVLGYGPHAMVVQPTELREQVGGLAAQTNQQCFGSRPRRQATRREAATT
jgi:predicted DNA-binding transcriptional regulator YafY